MSYYVLPNKWWKWGSDCPPIQPAFSNSKSSMETPPKKVKSVLNWTSKRRERRQLTLYRIHMLLRSFYCWLWTNKCLVRREGSSQNLKTYIETVSAVGIFLIKLTKETVEIGSPTRFWECWGQKSFGCLGERHKSKFPGRNSRQSTISVKVGSPLLPPWLGDLKTRYEICSKLTKKPIKLTPWGSNTFGKVSKACNLTLSR